MPPGLTDLINLLNAHDIISPKYIYCNHSGPFFNPLLSDHCPLAKRITYSSKKIYSWKISHTDSYYYFGLLYKKFKCQFFVIYLKEYK